jgi:hypothetical protein
MPDQPTTHAPHVDDSMAAEVEPLTRGAPVETRAQEFRMAEPPDDDVEIDAIIHFATDPVPGALGEAERRRRSELAIALRPHAFPGGRDELLRVAESEAAPGWILEALEQLPIDTRFDTPQEVWAALGGHRELRERDVDGDVVDHDHGAPPMVSPQPSPRAVERPAPTGLGGELRQIGACAVRLPLAAARRVARIAVGRLPGR